MKNTTTSSSVYRSIIEPLCPATAKWVEPASIAPNDRLTIDFTQKQDAFKLTIWAVPPASMPQSSTSVWRPSTAAWKHWPVKIPERKALAGFATWQAALTDLTAITIDATWSYSQIVFASSAVKTTYEYLLARLAQQTLSARVRADYKVDGAIPAKPTGWINNVRYPLSNYQKIAAWSFLKQDAQALFMEQGTGKTAPMIGRIAYEASKSDKLYLAIVVCPKNVRNNWAKEVHKFSTVSGRVAVLQGGQKERLNTLIEAVRKVPDDPARFSAIVCSYDALRTSWPALRLIEWDLSILDESHYVKGTATKRYKTVIELRDRSKQRAVMTGTPIPNKLFDLYGQLEFLGEGLSGFSSLKAMKKFYGKYSSHFDASRGKIVEKLKGFKNVPMLQERLACLAFMITKKEALPDLPAKTYRQVEIQMTPDQIDRYRSLKQQLALEIEAEDAASKNKQLTAANALVKLLRLAQITSGFYRWDHQESAETNELIDLHGIEFVDPVPKAEALVSLIRETEEFEKIIVWATFVPDIKKIKETLDREGIGCVTFYGATSDKDRKTAEKRFNSDPACKVLIGNPAAGGTGLNLLGYEPETLAENPDDEYHKNYNCSLVIYYSQNWSSTERSQSEDRPHRRGVRVPVNYVDLVVPGTIDDEIRARVVEKRDTASAIQDISAILLRLKAAEPYRGD